MKVVITQQADDNLFAIFLHHLEYSEDYALQFQIQLDEYIELLRDNPLMGHVYNEHKGIYRVVYQKRHNIYYVIRHDVLFIVYILDGQVDFNSDLRSNDAEIPALRERLQDD